MNEKKRTVNENLRVHWQGDVDVEVYATLPSTNRHLVAAMQAAESQQGHNTIRLCITDEQTAGVGRRGRSWHSASDSITFSIGYHWPFSSNRLMGMSLVTGVALAETLQPYMHSPVAVKWPNDLFVENKKLAGILVEVPLSTHRACASVTGVGLNFVDGPEHRQIDQPYVCMASYVHRQLPNKYALIGELTGAMLSAYDQFRNQGWQAFSARWQQRDFLYGREITVEAGSKRLVGTAAGVSAEGALLLNDGVSCAAIFGGDVSVRILD